MNSNITTLGYVIRDFSSLHDWCNRQLGMKSMSSSLVTFDRTHKWFGYEVILLKPHAKIKKGNLDIRVSQLGDRIFPGWNCALLCHYSPGGGMIRHCDHSVFEPFVASVNVGLATFCIGNEVHHLTDGQVIQFDSSIPHELLPVASHRWSLSFRRIKPQYLHF